MKNINKVVLGAIALILSSGLTLSNAFANAPAAEVATEAAKQTTGDMAKQAAGEVADSAKEKVIGAAKEQASKAVDTGVEKATKALSPKDVAVDAAKEAKK